MLRVRQQFDQGYATQSGQMLPGDQDDLVLSLNKYLPSLFEAAANSYKIAIRRILEQEQHFLRQVIQQKAGR